MHPTAYIPEERLPQRHRLGQRGHRVGNLSPPRAAFVMTGERIGGCLVFPTIPENRDHLMPILQNRRLRLFNLLKVAQLVSGKAGV